MSVLGHCTGGPGCCRHHAWSCSTLCSALGRQCRARGWMGQAEFSHHNPTSVQDNRACCFLHVYTQLQFLVLEASVLGEVSRYSEKNQQEMLQCYGFLLSWWVQSQQNLKTKASTCCHFSSDRKCWSRDWSRHSKSLDCPWWYPKNTGRYWWLLVSGRMSAYSGNDLIPAI